MFKELGGNEKRNASLENLGMGVVPRAHVHWLVTRQLLTTAAGRAPSAQVCRPFFETRKTSFCMKLDANRLESQT